MILFAGVFSLQRKAYVVYVHSWSIPTIYASKRQRGSFDKCPTVSRQLTMKVASSLLILVGNSCMQEKKISLPLITLSITKDQSESVGMKVSDWGFFASYMAHNWPIQLKCVHRSYVKFYLRTR